jgi:RNA-directed DNA polymerase
MTRECHVRFCESAEVQFLRATHLVILCRTAEEAEAALRRVTVWTAANGLTLHPDKTRIGDARQPGRGFDFLGYRFEGGRR